MTTLYRALICAISVGAAGCVISFNEDLLGDSSPQTDSTHLDAACQECRELGADQNSVDDQAKVPDAKGSDLPPVSCTSWSDWSCSNKPNSSVGRCPKTGTQVYSLVCNASGCSCTNVITSTSQPCTGSFAKVCADVQTAFTGGCCSGL